MMTAPQSARNALEALDEAIADAPRRNGHALSRAATCVSAFREELIAQHGLQGEENRQRLARVNAILSLVLAGHFPLGDAPWDEIKKGRNWLSEMIGPPPAA
jgi:hypothetical protein